MPEDWSIGVAGDEENLDRRIMSGKTFDLLGTVPADLVELEQVQKRAKFHKGWFSDTLPAFIADEERMRKKTGLALHVALLHIDCDIYSSTKTIFENLKPYIKKGTVIVFDELVNYPAFREHELKAFYELLKERPDLSFEWIGTACGVDSVMGLAVGALEGDGTCLAAAVRIISAVENVNENQNLY